jgi:hypothetical protein
MPPAVRHHSILAGVPQKMFCLSATTSFHRKDLQLKRESTPSDDMWADWSDEVQANAERAPADEITPPPADVEVTFLVVRSRHSARHSSGVEYPYEAFWLFAQTAHDETLRLE